MQLTLLIDPPQDGLTNMAVDEALLGMAAAGEIGPVLRFYQWSPATLSLGYFQRYAERAAHPASAECDVVRRASGGGAILHDRELTYSLVLPAGHPLAARAEPLYRAVHQALIDVLAEHGLDVRFWDQVQPSKTLDAKISTPGEGFACGDTIRPESQSPGTQSRRSATPEPFLCFQRRSPGDLVLRAPDDTSSEPAAWHKILGSAQRRRHGAVLQHGSLLWACSRFAPELPGLVDLAGTYFADINLPELSHPWCQIVAHVLGLTMVNSGSSSKYADSPWVITAREKFHEHDWLASR